MNNDDERDFAEEEYNERLMEEELAEIIALLPKGLEQ